MLNQRTINPTDMSFQPNTIYCGDCKDVLKHFQENCVDLIYLDPPFFSNRRYEVIWDDGYELRAFEDRWKGGISNYVGWMMERLTECHRVLKPTGSLYLHLDDHASHYMKVEMDKLFGENNFVNEIIWKRRTAHSDMKQGAQHLGKIHDTILFYTKSSEYTWHPQYVPYSKEYIEKGFPFKEPGTGRYYQLNAITGPGGASKGNPHYEFLGVTRYWRFKKETMERLYAEGKIVQTKPGNVPRQKRYLDEMPGVELQDIWLDIKPVSNQKEDLGYPTQKPEELLERIINLSSNPMDIVLDPFCGCGTAIAVAHKLGRRWVGIDVSPTACKLMAKRMRSLYAKVSEVGLPKNVAELKKLQPFEFQNWVMDKLYARVNPKKVGDMGIDGYYLDGTPIQVKQSEDVGRNVVDNFETAIKRMDRDKGVIVAFSFGKGAHEEVARAKLKEALDITLKTVEDILKET